MAEYRENHIQQYGANYAAWHPRREQAELIDRIHLYFAEVNADPVIFRWKYKMDKADIV